MSEREQVPVGTSVRLLDKVFAKRPRLKDNHLWEYLDSQAAQAGATQQVPTSLPPHEIDDSVSTDATELTPAFEPYRCAQRDAERAERPLTLDGIAALHPVEGRDAKRRCALR